jgi:hypothetical protein
LENARSLHFFHYNVRVLLGYGWKKSLCEHVKVGFIDAIGLKGYITDYVLGGS